MDQQEKRLRLKYLMNQSGLNDEEFEERDMLLEELKLEKMDSPTNNLETQVKILDSQLQRFVLERKKLTIENKIRKEQFKIQSLKNELSKKPRWCGECKEWVLD